MNIALYFGSFNPIHLGHTALAKYVLCHGGVDELWLVVSPNNPLKESSELADEKLRLQMAKIATRSIEGVKVSDIEFGMPKPNYTINTLRTLSSHYPEHNFSLVIGSDNMRLFDRWREHEAILRDYTVLVYPRERDDLMSLHALYPQMHILKGAPLLQVCATQIRKALASGSHEYDNWLDPKVREIFLRFCLHMSDKSSIFAKENKKLNL